MPKGECVVFPTARCIRHALFSFESGIIPHMITMGDFLGRITLAPSLLLPDNDLRLLALHEASDFSAFSTLQIERNFFSFIQNSQYIFRFFEELASEEVGIDALQRADVYGEYEEHITILSHLRSRYRDICIRNGWCDPIFASETLQLNCAYLKSFDALRIVVEGYLTRREINLLRACAEIIPLSIQYNTTAYNRKMTERFLEMGIVLEEGNEYVISLSDKTILSSVPLFCNRGIECEIFYNRLSQIGFIKARIELMVKGGIAPENIVVVLPDEGFVEFLKEFDVEENFNFAMGSSLENDPLFRSLEAIVLFLDESTEQNKARVQKVPLAYVSWLRERYYRPFNHTLLAELLEMMGEAKSDALELITEEVHRFSHLGDALSGMDFKSVLRIFMNRLRSATLDDVRGGKITVMGLLETRGMSYDGVIVVDFNEGFVPHKSQKDLFLNTTTRQFASLPTTNDRESLQKHYYSMLFNRAKSVAIGCVQNSESVPSRFLLQLGIEAKTALYSYERVLFAAPSLHPRNVGEFNTEYDFTKHPLSASGLKDFLTCRRKFYFSRIAKIASHELPRDMSQERDIGNTLHRALELLYTDKDSYATVEQIKQRLNDIWSNEANIDALERYMRRLWLDKLNPFYENEIVRFREGHRVAYREKEGSAMVEGITLIGRIDRIDHYLGALEVIDYKSGKFADTDKEPKEGDVDYQLSVYALLAREFGDVHRCGYYDLSTGVLKFEQYLEVKIDRLREILREMAATKQWDWEMCEEVSRCRYCVYGYLCHREAFSGI
ncbi:RecB family exonuclease [Sulfuricurvum sp.]|uniref:PD-(D/E)XK nuclease family protein n=1 Tax=Sulfuricurvum sp. TaxID=2025608 RepID=UPI0035642243